jgi:hypothetical protein
VRQRRSRLPRVMFHVKHVGRRVVEREHSAFSPF